MSAYTVTWHPKARDELAHIWLRALDRNAVAEAANRIDQALRDNPENCGEEFYGDRILVDLPLAITFAVFPNDRRVQVLQVWHQ
jgi:plasmid stabilization system protein ParE